MKIIINKSHLKKIIIESVVDLKNKETVEEFVNRFHNENSNPKFLENHLKVPNFRLELTHDGNVKQKKYHCSLPNKCETNTFIFIKDMVTLNNHRFYPVSGWAFLESTVYYEHFWVYDAAEDIFLDVSPMGNDIPYAYGGVINFKINDDILNAEKYNEIPFLLGKVGHSLYHKHIDSDKLPITKKQNKSIFDFIHNTEKYSVLSKFIKERNINSIQELKEYIPKLKDLLLMTRNNRDYEYLDNLIKQIKYFDIN